MKMKKILSALIACAVVGVSVPAVTSNTPEMLTASASEEYAEGTYGVLTYKNYGDHIEISDCDTSVTAVDIPASIDGLPVTSVGKEAFSHCSYLTSVVIPDSVTSIGNFAFEFCRSLTNVNISNSVASIGDQAFLACYDLTSIIIPDSVTSIGRSAFFYCSDLQSITVDSANKYYTSEDGVLFNKDKTTLIKYPEGRTNTEYVIPDSINLIGDGAFYNCEALTSVTIPDSVTSIGAYAFKSCTSLTSITISESVTSIGDHAFFACSALRSINVDPLNEYYSSQDGILFNKDKTTLIQYPSGKTNTKYTVPDSVNSISSHAFDSCSALTSITIPDSVTSIGSDAFNSCSALTKITIPDSVTEIHYGAFCDCLTLKSITILNPECILYDDPKTISNDYDSDTKTEIYTGTICGYADSTAQAYADLYGYAFKAIDNIGDIDFNGVINALDASLILTEYAAISTGQASTLDDIAKSNADVNSDGAINALDASYILSYYAHIATGGTGSILEFI